MYTDNYKIWEILKIYIHNWRDIPFSWTIGHLYISFPKLLHSNEVKLSFINDGEILIFYKVIKFQRMCINACNAYIPHSLYLHRHTNTHTHTQIKKSKTQKNYWGLQRLIGRWTQMIWDAQLGRNLNKSSGLSLE